ncbi:uncharacterized protein PG998_010009 [Apiospora kogelbergensis]|uniref:uncharacterized protein n=1 Tax=Apiospora kogelbergensis TaxID=1337665 RepID=UPI00312EF4A4
MPETPATPSFRWPGYLAHQTIGEENHINHLPSQEFELEAENTEQSSDDPRLLWPPKYLRRSVIATFILIFAFLIVAIEALVIVSARNDGIATSRSELHYLWTYGPTAFLTLVAAFWSRVEYQSKLVAPWRNLMQQHSVDSEHTLLLDYISGLQPLIIVKAFRNMDWMVLITCTVSIFIKILIVISTGLVTLSWIKVHLNAQPIVLKDTFLNNDSRRLSETKLTSYYIMQGLISQNLSYPDGMSKDYAFQSTTTTLPDSAETRVTVDGLTNGLDCVPVDFSIPRGDFQVRFLAGGGTTSKGNVNVSIASSGCNITNQPLAIPDWFNVYGSLERTLSYVHPWRIMDAQLKSWNNIGPFPMGRLHDRIHNWGAHMDVDQYMGLAMDSQLGIDTSTSPTDLLNPNALNQLAEAYYRQHAAIIAKQLLMEPASIETTGSSVSMENRLVVRDWAQLMVVLIIFCLILCVGSLFTVLDQSIPRNPSCITDMAALLLHSHDLKTTLRGLSATNEKDLVAGLARRNFKLGTIRDIVTKQTELIIHDEQQCDSGTPQGFVRIRTRSNPHPRILHPGLRLALCSVLIALIVGLDLLLQRSNEENGLQDVVSDKYMHYLWTTTPAIILGAITLVVSSMDFQIRSLGPYMMLRAKISSEALLKLDHMDMSIPHTMYREFKLGNIGALATSATIFIASTFTIFSASLFQTLDAPIKELVTLRANQSFLFDTSSGSWGPLDNLSAGTIASLILGNNLSYPGFTYGNMAFPQLLTGLTTTSNLSSVSTKATIPAVRGKLHCRLYNSSQHRLNFTLNHNTTDNPLAVWIEGEDCKSGGMFCSTPSSNSLITTHPNTSYIGQAQEMVRCRPPLFSLFFSPLKIRILVPDASFHATTASTGLWIIMFANCNFRGCSDLLYTWGRIEWSGQPVVQHIASTGCNVSFEGLDVDVTFLGTDLQIDKSPENAPRTREETVYDLPSGRARDRSQAQAAMDYKEMETGRTGRGSDAFFDLLVSSQFAIPMSDLGNKAADAKVVEAIIFQHGIIQAQNFANTRVAVNEPDATTLLTNSSSKVGSDDEGFTVYNATATDTSGQRRRVKQDAASTRALQGLLGATLVLLVISWLFTFRGTNVLPRAPTSIASVAALIAGGNLLDKLPPDAQRLDKEALAAALGAGTKTRYWIGWRTVPDSETGRKTRRFGIFAVEEDDDPNEDSEWEGDEEGEQATGRSTASDGAEDNVVRP